MELNQALNALDMLQRKMAAYDHAMGVIYYDGATVAPSGTAQNRGESLAILSQVSYELSTCKDTEELLEALWAEKDRQDEAQTRQVFLLRKSLEELRKIPVDEFVAYQKLVNEAEDVWHRAKNDDDFAAFCPYIDKIVEANKKFAGYVKPEMDPYEYCLDKYEEGLTRETCDNFFAALREKFSAALDNDLNSSLAVTAIYDVLKAKTNDATKLYALKDFDRVLSLELTERAAKKREELKKQAVTAGQFTIISESGEENAEVEAKIQARQDAKKAKNFAEADRIRDELKAEGIEITDIPHGAKWKRI